MKQYWFGMHCESPVDRGILVEVGVRAAVEIFDSRRDRRGRPAAAPGDPLAAPEQTRSQGRRRVAMHDGTGTQWNGGQALSITHAIECEPSKLIAAVSGGWPIILSNLKSLLETGFIRSCRSLTPLTAPAPGEG